MDTLIPITNVLLLILWVGAWQKSDSRDSFFNPHLARLSTLCQRVTDFLQPVLPWLSARYRAAVALLFLLLFRGFLLYNTAALLVLTVGPKRIDPAAPPLFEATFNQTHIRDCLSYSLLSFFTLAFALGAISLLYSLLTRGKQNAIMQALDALSGPPPSPNPLFRSGHLLLFGCALVIIVSILGAPTGVYPGTPPITLAPRLFLAIAAAIVGSFETLYTILIALIIVSFVGALTGRLALLKTAHEFITFLMGPLAHRPLRMGAFDFTPLIFLLAINLMQVTATLMITAAANLLP